MKKLIFLIMTLNLLGCGSSPAVQPTKIPSYDIPDSECDKRDLCTYPNINDVTGYYCQTTRYEPDMGEGAALPTSFYAGYRCVITSEDFQTEPGCDPATSISPAPVGWAEKHDGGYCPIMQGPGPATILH